MTKEDLEGIGRFVRCYMTNYVSIANLQHNVLTAKSKEAFEVAKEVGNVMSKFIDFLNENKIEWRKEKLKEVVE